MTLKLLTNRFTAQFWSGVYCRTYLYLDDHMGGIFEVSLPTIFGLNFRMKKS